MRNDTFYVDEETIKIGLQQDRGDCAVALAIKLRNPDYAYVQVDREKITLSDLADDQRYTFRTPVAIRNFIDDFDRDKASVKPFTFHLDSRYATSIKNRTHSDPRKRAVRKAQTKDRPIKQIDPDRKRSVRKIV